MNRVSICIPSYNGNSRLEYMLKTMKQNDPGIFDTPINVVEDPCGKIGVTEGYADICEEYGLTFNKLSKWSNMHGAARQAFDIAMKYDDPEWIIYLGDDLAITKNSLTQLVYFITENKLETVGLVQPSYWNSHEYEPILNKGEWFYQSTGWVNEVEINPQWGGSGPAFPYVNVNGAGFACRASMYRDVGGFAEKSWRLDETLSVRCWMKSEYSIVALPGQPFVHFFGGSTLANPPKHTLHSEEAWVEAMGHSTYCMNGWSYAKMFERKPKVDAEMAGCVYFDTPRE